MNNIVKIKFHRNQAGTVFPYDAIYLVRREDQPLISKIFGYALVLPLEKEFTKSLFEVKPQVLSHFKFNRDDAAMNMEVKVEGSPEKWWSELFNEHNLHDRVVVVPILTANLKDKAIPRYLAPKKWFQRQERSTRRRRFSSSEKKPSEMDPAISELAYLATPLAPPHDTVRPLCGICPRAMLHLQGECIPGMEICYKSLDFNKINFVAKKDKASDASI
jgi:hypothetical protein